MTLSFLSPSYFLCLAIVVLFLVGVFFLFRKSSQRTKKAVLLVLMLLNVGQHLLKCFVWPHLYGTGFGLSNTAYNVCATLILASPFVLFFGKGAIRDAMVYIGTAGPMLAMVVPYWFQGQPLFQWEVLRFYFCHVLLVATSLLPALWGVYRLSYKRALLVPLFFFLVLIVIVLNHIICYALGLWGEGTDLFAGLYELNPCWLMHPAPPAGFEWAQAALEALTPSVFLGNGTRPYTPLLWYFIPMYLLLSLVAFLLGILFDRKHFAADCKKLAARIRGKKRTAR